jgi:hypothetical protein
VSHLTRRALGVVGVIVVASGLMACSSVSATDEADEAGETAPATTSVEADAIAVAALHEAAAAMSAVGSYRFTATIETGGTTNILAGEFVAPDRVHQTVTTADGQVIETLYAGGQAWAKDASGVWRTTAATTASTPSPTALFSALQAAESVTGDDASVRFELTGDASFLETTAGPEAVSGEASITDGHLSRLTYRPAAAPSAMVVTLEYADLGAPLTVDVPST